MELASRKTWRINAHGHFQKESQEYRIPDRDQFEGQGFGLLPVDREGWGVDDQSGREDLGRSKLFESGRARRDFTAAHGYFQPYENLSAITKAKFLNDASAKTPVFVRFSTVAGSRGSADTVRDVRGFAVKFYTEEGNYDLVGNNIPVFFIQDAIKFPDLIHAAKGEPHNEIPQAQTAHDTFWDFAGMTPESTHMLLWIMSDRAIPRSLAMMEGFGVHTFRFVNAKGEGRFVKFHWKPLLGTHALVWDEAQKLAGKDPDFQRRGLFESIERGYFPEWELGVQIVEEKDEHKFPFDLLDPTKLIPEEMVPVRRIGKMVLNRNPDNFFAETEQVAFCAAHVVPGIDFTNDRLLQGRLFSYTDTQLSRLGGPNFHEIPINRPVCPFLNFQRDGMHRQSIDVGRVACGRNSLQSDTPGEAKRGEGFESFTERVDGRKIRMRSESFGDHFSQAWLFWESQTPVEQQHIVDSFSFELGKCEVKAVREQILVHLAQVQVDLVTQVAAQLGMPVPTPASTPKKTKCSEPSSALSMIHPELASVAAVKGRKLAILVADGVAGVFVAGDKKSVDTLLASGDAIHYVMEAYKHRKALRMTGEVSRLLESSRINSRAPGVLVAEVGALSKSFIAALSLHRHWERPDADSIPALGGGGNHGQSLCGFAVFRVLPPPFEASICYKPENGKPELRRYPSPLGSGHARAGLLRHGSPGTDPARRLRVLPF